MKFLEPEQNWQSKQHQRILKEDVTVFAEICEQALPYLVSFLQSRFPEYNPHLHETVAIDCLLTYQANPQQYDPQQLSLYAYLRMVARSDMLNLLDKRKRQNRRLLVIDAADSPQAIFQQESISDKLVASEWLTEYTDHSHREIIQEFIEELDETDQQILLLMLEGVRRTEDYAAVIGITHLEIGEQRLKVKRAKDRITKKIQRFGNQFGKR
ncbi:MAG: hypothetical protein GY796_12355 [Chloroflexi bacterium]|nr:hypothetical protein [Chloroflexota bacterium]